MRKPLALPVTALAMTLAVGLAATPAQARTPVAVTAQSVHTPGNLSEEQARAHLARLRSLLPEDYRARIAALNQRFGVTELDAQPVLERPTGTGGDECATTPLQEWVTASQADWTEYDRSEVVPWVDFFRSYDAILFGTDAEPQRFGASEDFTATATRAFRGLTRFWDVPSDDIQLVAMHGTTALDPAKVTRLMVLLFGYTEADAAQFAADFVPLVNQAKFDYGKHPSLSYDAFVFYGGEYAGVGAVGPKILIGDGMLDAYAAIGLGEVAAQAVVAHEYGHLIQAAGNLFESNLPGPEASRRLEMMADGFSAYFLGHVRGAALNRWRLQQATRVFANLGDCVITSPAHHGTPEQRARAAGWGYHLARDAHKRGQILPSLEVAQLFDQKLPELVAAGPA